ncbi:hypothetical protein L6452_06091 [Arctium lappa]|uniref:Uncharacterized protein n=1 Tax=Arctium lappa TaxID=4217 RepID=A0ACB9EII3_ARCLA|nr:hypothetical protein L6452_06091 [Arctium lappa]
MLLFPIRIVVFVKYNLNKHNSLHTSKRLPGKSRYSQFHLNEGNFESGSQLVQQFTFTRWKDGGSRFRVGRSRSQ